MSEGEEWDAAAVAAECAAAAREKARAAIRARHPDLPDDDRPIRDEESGRFVPGHLPIAFGGGAPSKYQPEYVDQARRLAQIGATNPEMAAFFEVAVSTFHLWRNVHPEFNEAVKIGKAPADDRVERSLYERATGYDYTEEVAIKVRDGVGKDATERVEVVQVQKHVPADPTCIIYWTTNRRPEEWKHRRTIEHSGTIEHVTPDQARRELADFYANGSGDIIEGEAILIPAPDEADAAETAP